MGVVIAEVFHEAGFPKGVLNLVTNGPGRSGEIGDEFIENPKVRRISLTGSSAVGRQLAEKAGRHLKRVALELGGQNPMIVLRDANVDEAVNAAAFGGFLHQGQICMSTRRVIVEKPIAKEFTEKFVKKVSTFKVGNPKEPDTIIGPLINQQQFQRSQEQRGCRRQGWGEDLMWWQIRGTLLPSDGTDECKARDTLFLRRDFWSGDLGD